jgi:hypothetical protein
MISANSRKWGKSAWYPGLFLAAFLVLVVSTTNFTHTCFSGLTYTALNKSRPAGIARETELGVVCLACLLVASFNTAKPVLLTLIFYFAMLLNSPPQVERDHYFGSFISTQYVRGPPVHSFV